MKSPTPLYVLLVLSLTILGVLWSFPALERQEAAPVFAATIHRDCAPWDGWAFTVSIPIAKSLIGISIYQSPDLKLPATFSFPDDTGRIGNAVRVLPATWPDQLIGRISFQRVEPGMPVEGEFDFLTDMGEQFKGKFIAEWDRQFTACG
jgi:hypothetical protein